MKTRAKKRPTFKAYNIDMSIEIRTFDREMYFSYSPHSVIYEVQCRYCKKWPSAHLGVKCLFDAGTYARNVYVNRKLADGKRWQVFKGKFKEPRW